MPRTRRYDLMFVDMRRVVENSGKVKGVSKPKKIFRNKRLYFRLANFTVTVGVIVAVSVSTPLAA